MASFSEVKWRLQAYKVTLSLDERPSRPVVNITLNCVSFGSCSNNMRGFEVISRHINAPHKTKAFYIGLMLCCIARHTN